MNRRAFLSFAASATLVPRVAVSPAASVDDETQARVREKVREARSVGLSAIEPAFIAANWPGVASVEETRDVLDEMVVEGEASLEYMEGDPIYVIGAGP